MKTMIYFDYNGIPASIGYKELPVKYVGGKEVVIYSTEKFFREAVVITKKEFDKMMQK